MAEPRATAIDLNADVGEGFDDAPLYPFLSSVNVACGGHAGDEHSMARTVTQAAAAGLAIGAHPSFADRPGFGRRVTTTDAEEIAELVAEQTRALAAIADAQGAVLAHVKPHGALYNLSASDSTIADAIARAVHGLGLGLALVGLAGSASLTAARARGLVAVAEGFVDRGYQVDGALIPRSEPGALIEEPEAAAVRAVALARGSDIATPTGATLRLSPDTLCLHGDTPGAVPIAAAVYAGLRRAGIRVEPTGLSFGGYPPKSS
ncbi:MAG: LamB/YcsF family protein [Candidatus Binatia bacterium]|nr:LamB/YcsF family protein [Candidatus Binatia bacterium]